MAGPRTVIVDRRRATRAGFLALLLIGSFAVADRASAYSALFGFGDSLSDTGNVLTNTGGPGVGIPLAPYVDGRFSNGPVWIEQFAANLGLSANAALLGGTNFAFGGAATGTPPDSTSPTVVEQVGLFLGGTGGLADPDALYVVFGGGNDVRVGDTSSSVGNISSAITTLAGAGATTFFVPNLPDIGQTPEALGTPGLSPIATALSVGFNSDLAIALQGLRTSLGVTIFEFDTFGWLNGILADPGASGLSNVDTACYDGTTGIGGPGNVCADPDQYVFWDAIHPTAATHALFGDAAFAVIPLPAAVWLFGSALGILGWLRRRAV